MEREYFRNKLGHVGYIDGKYIRFNGFSTYPIPRNLEPATAEEIAAFVKEEKRRKANRKEREKKEVELLALCDLAHDDFVRFRKVWRDGDILYVCTRENGVNSRSVIAIKNPNYLISWTNEDDSTYEYHSFKIPEVVT
jgi:hypothetical protein